MDLKAKITRGGKFSAEDIIETQLTYTGDIKTCIQKLELISGVDVLHGGGATATTPLHYKSTERDADDDGIIDYTTTEMQIVQVEKGVSVIKIVADVLLKADYDTHAAALRVWSDAYATSSTDEDGNAVEDAKVTLLMGNDVIFDTGLTDENGQINLSWDMVESGVMDLTVIKRNYRPYEGEIEISSASGFSAIYFSRFSAASCF